MSKKAQAAMEFLMTYGWAILVVLIAIGALAYFGVLSPEKFLPEKCLISSDSGLFCQDFSASADTGITLRIRNILPNNVIITSISTDIPSCIWSGTNIIAPDGYTDFTLDCTEIAAGDKIKAIITINYKVTETGLLKTRTGQLITKVKVAVVGSVNYQICKNADDYGLCDGLDILFGEGYRQACCDTYNLCC